MTYGNYAPFYRAGYFNPMQTNMNEPQGQYMAQYQQNLTPMTNNDMIWVLNENEAVSYPVAPNNNVVLWDKSTPTIYIKSVNAQGVPSMRVLDFTERTQNEPKLPEKHDCKCGNKFVTKEEFDALKGKFYDLQARYDKITTEEKEATVEKPKAKTTKKEAENDG